MVKIMSIIFQTVELGAQNINNWSFQPTSVFYYFLQLTDIQHQP